MVKTIGNASAESLAKVAARAGKAASAAARAAGHAVTGTRTVEIDGRPMLCIVKVAPSGEQSVLKVLGPASGGVVAPVHADKTASRGLLNHKR